MMARKILQGLLSVRMQDVLSTATSPHGSLTSELSSKTPMLCVTTQDLRQVRSALLSLRFSISLFEVFGQPRPANHHLAAIAFIFINPAGHQLGSNETLMLNC